MSFIEQRVIGPDERLIGISSIHWIYGARGLVFLTVFMSVGLGIKQFTFWLAEKFDTAELVPSLNIFSNAAFIICTVIGLLLLLFYIIMMISTELGLTTKRVVFKTGLIFVDVREVDLEEIKAADVDNGFLGYFLNYGYIILDARFIKNLTLPAISAPYRFVRAMNQARTIEKRNAGDSLQKILEQVVEVSPSDEPANIKPVVFNRENLKQDLRNRIKDSFSRARRRGMRHAPRARIVNNR